MNRFEFLKVFTEHHSPSMGEAVSNTYYFCDGVECTECKVWGKCDELGMAIIYFSYEEMLTIKEDHPEYFL